MNHRIAMSKFLQRTCLALNQHPAELVHTNATAVDWSRCLYKRRDNSPCNPDAMTMTTALLMTSSKRFHSKFIAGPHHHPTARLGTAIPLCREKAYELVLTLNDAERSNLKAALTKYETMKLKEGFEVLPSRYKCRALRQAREETRRKREERNIFFIRRLWRKLSILAATRWRTRFGRPTNIPPPLSNIDPSGEFCTFPEDWLQENAEAKAAPPTTSDLYKIFFVNAVPFVAFGFLDNFCMITAGDYIEQVVGTFMCISTMAAAGLGNTLSDILGIGTAFYVETFCTFMGLKPPELSVIQMEMKQCRRAANIGRILGITLGCLLGMFPLLLLKKEDPPPPSPTAKSDKNKKKS